MQRKSRIKSSHGYWMIRAYPDRPGALAYEYEHRIVAEKKIGRSLKSGEIVHHIDGNKKNNDSSNLEVLPGIAHHKAKHRTRKDKREPGALNPLVECACECGSLFEMFDSSGRPRKYRMGHGKRNKGIRLDRIRNGPVIECACGCGVEFPLYDKWGRERRYLSGHNDARGGRR